MKLCRLERNQSRDEASALLLVLWALILLSAAIFGFAKWMQQDIQLYGEANRDLEARAMAHSGIAFALAPQVSKLTPGLEQDFGGGLGFQVRIVSEGSKLNIAKLLDDMDGNPLKRDLLTKWLGNRGLNANEIEVFIDCLLDWIDADNTHHLNGVEEDGDYHAPQPGRGRLFNVNEIAQVRGSNALTRTPGWAEALTIESNAPMDLLSAGPELLSLLPNVRPANIQYFLKLRRGPDGIDGTLDDYVFKEPLKTVPPALGMSQQQVSLYIGILFDVDDPILRISSRGHSGNAYRQVEVVVGKAAGRASQILSWKE